MTRSMFPALAAGTVMAMLAGAAVTSQGPNIIENRGQAMPKGARRAIRDGRDERQARARRAADELVRVSNQTLVVAHLHPRWLRDMAIAAMDAGAMITRTEVEVLRAHGPEGAQAVVEAYRGR